MTGQNEQLTREQAEACLKIVQEWIDKKQGVPGWEVTLYEPGFHCDGWSAALEGTEIEWPWLMSTDESVTWPDGVFAEPGASWYLGLYVLRSPRI